MSIETFHRWVGRHRDRVYNFAYYTLRHAEDAEDVTQEVLIRMWHHRNKLEDPTVLAWLLKVTRNACYDTLRRHKTRRARFDEGIDEYTHDTVASDEPGPQEHAEADDFLRRLSVALETLPEHYRTVVVLREIEGLKYDEIAEVTGRPVSSVKVYLHRGRKLLRESLEASTDTAASPSSRASTHNGQAPADGPKPTDERRAPSLWSPVDATAPIHGDPSLLKEAAHA